MKLHFLIYYYECIQSLCNKETNSLVNERESSTPLIESPSLDTLLISFNTVYTLITNFSKIQFNFTPPVSSVYEVVAR